MKILLLAALGALYAQAQLTTVAGTLYLPDGSKYSGNITCTWPTPFVGGDGRIMPAGPQVATSVKNGALSIQLEANDTATPTGTYYTCTYRPTGAGSVSETWQVPYSASPVALTSVRLPTTPTSPTFAGIVSLNGLTPATQLFARTNDTNINLTISSAVSTHTFAMSWAGTLAGSRGGLGANASAFTGLLKMTSGVASVATAGTDYIAGVANLTTTGAVPYVSSTGTLNQDASNLFWGAANHQLGIGTNTFPDASTKLNILGASTVTVRIAANNGGNTDAELALVSGGGGSSGDHALISFAQAGTAKFFNTGVWNGIARWAIRDVPAGFVSRLLLQASGNFSVGNPGSESDNNAKFSVLSSGSSQTVLIQDQTPATGATQIGVIAGAGQGSSNLMLMQGATYQGIWDNNGQYSVGVIGGDRKASLFAGGGMTLTSDLVLAFKSTTSLDSGTNDTCASRAAAGVLLISDCTNPSKLKALGGIFTATTSYDSDLANSTCSAPILTTNTNAQLRCRGADGVMRHIDYTLVP